VPGTKIETERLSPSTTLSGIGPLTTSLSGEIRTVGLPPNVTWVCVSGTTAAVVPDWRPT
jgi:hypothetical protein